MAEISGGEVMARMLQQEGVEKVFGIIDGTYFGFYEALHASVSRSSHHGTKPPLPTWQAPMRA